MSSYKTTNLALHKWAGTDPIDRTEFNENFVSIDTKFGEQTALIADRATNATVALKADKSYVDSKKADITYVDSKVNSIASGSPKGVYPTLVDLQTAYPSGTTGIYLVTTDGKWYYWNGTSWTAGGQYQSTGIAEKSVEPTRTTFLGDPSKVWPSSVDMTYTATQTGTFKSIVYEITSPTVNDFYTLSIDSVSGNLDDVFAEFTSYRANGTTVKNVIFKASESTKSGFQSITTEVVRIKVSLFACQATSISVGQQVTWRNVRLLKNASTDYKLDLKVKIDQENMGNVLFVPESTTFFTGNYNLYNNGTFTSGFEINKTTGVLTTNTNSAYSDYIPVRPGSQYYKKYFGAVIFYNQAKEFMSGLDLNTADGIYTTPYGCYFVRVNIVGTANFVNEIFCDNSVDHKFLLPYDTKFIQSKFIDTRQLNGWYGKKMTTFGHSIVAMERWQRYVANNLGLTHVNCGIGGSSVAGTNGTTGNNPMWTDARINTIPTDSNLIIILAGLNDYTAGSANMGTIDNETDTESFYGAYQTMLNKLYVRCPNARIVIMIDLYRNEPSSAVQTVYTNLRNATREIAKKYNYPTIESTEFGFNKLNYSTFYEPADSVHPSTVGGARMADVVIGRLKDISPYNSTLN